MKYLALFGRILFSFIFVMTSLVHFSKQTIEFGAAQGIPLASIAGRHRDLGRAERGFWV